MPLYVSSLLEREVRFLQNNSPTARGILEAMKHDKKSFYSIGASTSATHAHGCGKTTQLEKLPSLWERMIQNKKAEYTFIMEVNPSQNCSVIFTDIAGKPFKPSIERILAHEIGHGYTYLLYGPFPRTSHTVPWYHEAIKYENIIAKELDPSAPERAISDHGDPLGRYINF